MSLPNTSFGPAAIGELLKHCRSIFFIGIGGVSMCSLAEITLRDGLCVSGSDRTESDRLARLRDMGAEIFLGHAAEHIASVDAVVYTVAIGEENPEYRAALAKGLPLISRADYLGYVMMRYPVRIGVAGMNGKSTTTAMCAHLLMQSGDPTVFGGADAAELGGASCRIGEKREQFIFEACEYKDSFLDLSPTLAVILNIGMDHVDYFHSMEQIRASFLAYAKRVGEDGVALVNADDPELTEAMREYRGRLYSFGLGERADFRAVDVVELRGRRSYTLTLHGEPLCKIKLRQPGEFQVYNSLAAASAAYLSGVSPQEIAGGVADFAGVKRRMEYRGRLNGADVFEDYSHHPSAIMSTFEGVCKMGYDRVLCAYQPHTYSRTAGLFDEFAASFTACDKVFFADIYAAREQNESGVSSEKLAAAVGENAVYCGELTTLAETLRRYVSSGDLLLIMGAGDIDRVIPMLPLTDLPE